MTTVTRKLTETEFAHRLANKVLDRVNADPDDDIAILARQFLRSQERLEPRPMSTAPRDGTHILAYLYSGPDDFGYRGFGEWREIFYKPMTIVQGWNTCWHAGDPDDSHEGNDPPDHFGESVPVAWMPLPRPPR